jgi:uncharacterized integral membrane protein
MSFRLILALLLLVLLTVFVAMNRQTSSVWVFGARAEMPVALLVFFSGVIGVCAGLLLAFVLGAKRKPDPKPDAQAPVDVRKRT